MFGLLDDVVDIALSPVKNATQILEGLSEGELRTAAIARLGSNAIAGLETYEIIELLAASLVEDEE